MTKRTALLSRHELRSRAIQTAYAFLDQRTSDDIDEAADTLERRIPGVGPIQAREIVAALGMWLERREHESTRH